MRLRRWVGCERTAATTATAGARERAALWRQHEETRRALATLRAEATGLTPPWPREDGERRR